MTDTKSVQMYSKKYPIYQGRQAPLAMFPVDQGTVQLIDHMVLAVLLECCSVTDFECLKQSALIAAVRAQATNDLIAFAMKDPASGRDLAFIVRSYTSYAAVLHYRIAHWVHKHAQPYLGYGQHYPGSHD